MNGILAAVMLLCAVPTTLLAEQTDTEEEFVIKEVGVPEGTDFQPEVIGQTEDGEDIYGSYIEAPEDTHFPRCATRIRMEPAGHLVPLRHLR